MLPTCKCYKYQTLDCSGFMRMPTKVTNYLHIVKSGTNWEPDKILTWDESFTHCPYCGKKSRESGVSKQI